MRSSGKSARLLTLLQVLHRYDSIKRSELLLHRDLAAYYGTAADRALRRDLATLAGRPFEALPPPDAPPPIDLPAHAWDIRYDRETACVSLASSRLSALRASEVDLLGTIEQSLRADPLLGARLSALLARLGHTTTSPTSPLLVLELASDYQPHLQTLQRIIEASQHNRAVNFEYRSTPASEVAFVEVDVTALELRDGHYYLCGIPARQGTELQFRVDRIVPGSLKIHPRYGNSRQRRRPTGVEVRYWLAPHLSARGVSRRLQGQQEQGADDGSVIVSGRARNLFEAERLLLGYGPYARALDPPELCRVMAENAQAMALLYAAEPNHLLD